MLDGLKVLAADDDTAIIALLKRMLPQLGVGGVVTAENASTAVEHINAATSPFDCVVADIYMERGTGLQLLHAIRTGQIRRARPDMCVVLMSGQANPELGQIARELDANGFLAKPFSMETLGAMIAKARRRILPLNAAKYARVNAAALGMEMLTASKPAPN